ncbi:MAG: Crp/Fnr family transcriptional regulator [Bacteroidales bacterium]|jgi:CRP-like cAMP-binding protein|nr:Crp/Fnr family transcriptional regulator [Bacteroidales bacterium]
MNTEFPDLPHAVWRSLSLLRHLNPDELAYLDEVAETRTYAKNEIIFTQSKRISGCYIVLSGIVKQFKTGGEGKEYIFRLAKAYEILGFRSVLSEEPACSTSTAIEDCTVCYIPKDCMHRLVKTNGDFALDLLQIACRELEESHSLITNIAQKSVKERLAELLLMLKNKFGVNEQQQLNIVLSREEVANVVGTATESIIRLLSEFRNDRYIDTGGKKIAILNEKALEKIAFLKG